MAVSCARSMWPAWSPPRIRRATSPGITRMITNTREATPSSVGTIRRSRLARYVHMAPAAALSVLRQPHVLELLVGVVTGRGHVIPHLRPVHQVPRPPEPRDEVRVLQDDPLDLVGELLALDGVAYSRLSREQVVHPGVGHPAPVIVGTRDEATEKQIGIVHELDRRVHHQLEVPLVPSIGKPGRRLERPV